MHFSALVKWEHHMNHADTQVYNSYPLCSDYEPFRITSFNLCSVGNSPNCSSATCWCESSFTRKPWLSSILFHQVNHYFEVLTKILPLQIHQCLKTNADSWSLTQLLTHETSLMLLFRPIIEQLDCLEGVVEMSSELP